jgi:hypothetical protein
LSRQTDPLSAQSGTGVRENEHSAQSRIMTHRVPPVHVCDTFHTFGVPVFKVGTSPELCGVQMT